MFCPKCRAEYREGFTKCSDCGEKLVASLGPVEKKPAAPVESVTVLKASSPAESEAARSMLEAAGCPCGVKSDLIQDFFGAGRMGTGYSLFCGPIEVQVLGSDEQLARELLAEPPEASVGADEDDRPQDETWTRGTLRIMARVFATLWLVATAIESAAAPFGYSVAHENLVVGMAWLARFAAMGVGALAGAAWIVLSARSEAGR